ncbi:PREDICTED: uncharacterized protein LOC109581166 [Amphimedon queenslandica]|uniref:Uncharacterized protein n=1 Tax=Amphimedon queenslandica TaxID=400682 RepID=A0A1X7V5B6_AMPQE|nr:PREDICTED: uncharacterized protein LOC109581166 [Amphimedon queenslandica]|eukprot:XP_019850574.1 PREDICTED: uncharacterized protein LOC109581166 [Amphimedon queenslandica]
MSTKHRSSQEYRRTPSEENPTPGQYFEKDWVDAHYEILFPCAHVTHLPWKTCDLLEELETAVPGLKSHEVKIESLIHITHNKEYRDMQVDDGYKFQSFKKVGKYGYGPDQYGKKPCGFSFIATAPQSQPDCTSLYRYIKSGKDLLPGQYIWWSVYIAEPPAMPDYVLPSPPFTKPDASSYGRNMISANIKDLLIAYQTSFKRDDKGQYPMIELRVGGTLRYKYEICYIIILCKKEELSDYPIWEPGRDKIKFDTDKDNAVNEIDPISITIKGGIKWDKNTYQSYSWEHFVFALHFNGDHHQQMTCSDETFSHKIINHDARFCLKKTIVSRDGSSKVVCPDS